MTAETNSLPARKPNDIADPMPSGLDGALGCAAGRGRGSPLEFARQPIEPRAQRGVVVAIAGVRTHGSCPRFETQEVEEFERGVK